MALVGITFTNYVCTHVLVVVSCRSADEITCTLLGNGSQAVLKHAAKRGSFFVKKLQSKEQLYFKPGEEEGNLEFQMEKSSTDQYAFALYVADPKNMSIRYFLMPETNNAESGIMELKEGRPQDKEYYVFGSSISVKFTK